MGKTLRALGLMSGTSMDGIDVALIETDGEDSLQRGPSGTYAYSETFRAQLRTALVEAAKIGQRHERPAPLAMVEQYLTDLHVEAVAQFLEDHRIDAKTVDIIGFHGQTVLHKRGAVLGRMASEPPPVPGETTSSVVALRPRTLTVQLGDGSVSPSRPASTSSMTCVRPTVRPADRALPSHPSIIAP